MTDILETLRKLTSEPGRSWHTGQEFVHGAASQQVIDALRNAATEIARLRAAPVGAAGVPIELDGVAKQLSETYGVWLSCSGCHHSNDGVPIGPCSSIMKCHIGVGCYECGGIGAVWDRTDYRHVNDTPVGELVVTLDRKLGGTGAAYDPPGPQRAYTYQHQPHNGPAYNLGCAVAATRHSTSGDAIDVGLILLRELEARGFGVFEITPNPAIFAEGDKP